MSDGKKWNAVKIYLLQTWVFSVGQIRDDVGGFVRGESTGGTGQKQDNLFAGRRGVWWLSWSVGLRARLRRETEYEKNNEDQRADAS